MRALTLILMLSLAGGARAQNTDEIEEALALLRRRIVFVDNSADARLIRTGQAVVAGTSFVILGASLFHAYQFLKIGRAYELRRIFTWAGGWPYYVPAALGAWGGGLIAVGRHRRAQKDAREHAVRPRARYESVEELQEFMGLSDAEQSAFAHRTPEFAAFLLRLKHAYEFVDDNRLIKEAP